MLIENSLSVDTHSVRNFDLVDLHSSIWVNSFLFAPFRFIYSFVLIKYQLSLFSKFYPNTHTVCHTHTQANKWLTEFELALKSRKCTSEWVEWHVHFSSVSAYKCACDSDCNSLWNHKFRVERFSGDVEMKFVITPIHKIMFDGKFIHFPLFRFHVSQ